jgi:YihY family inner membrane protein
MPPGTARALRLLRACLGPPRTLASLLSERHGFQHAAAIAYFATLSTVPFCVLLAAGFGFLVHALGPRYGSEERFLELMVRALHDLAPFLADEVATRLRAVVEARQAIGLVGGGVLFLSAGLVFEALGAALRELFGVPKPRHFLLSHLVFFVFLAGVAALGGALYLALVVADWWLAARGDPGLLALLAGYRVLDWGVSFLVVGGGFAAVVAWFSRTRLRPLAVLAGAGMFFALFEASRALFGWYVEHVARFDLLYGSLATLMVGIVWIYYGALVFMLSAAAVLLLDRRLRVGPGPEQAGAHPDEGGPLLDGHLEVARHAHAQVTEGLPQGGHFDAQPVPQAPQPGEVGPDLLGGQEGREGHQAHRADPGQPQGG